MSDSPRIDPKRPRPTWIASGRPIPRLVARPLRSFLDTEVAGGVVLLVGTILALVWANSPFSGSYESLWSTEISLEIGGLHIEEDLKHWVNDALMVFFFFVVGLEIKRELVRGELADKRKAALPVAAALGGMVVPALIYLAFNAGTAASRGWGIPMATDIAFALGVLALVAPRAPAPLKVFLLSLAIVDDIGAIVVIAIFYSTGVNFTALAIAVGLLGVVVILQRIKVWWIPIYGILGFGIWLATFESGVHATLAGVALGLLTPVQPLDKSQRRRIPLFESDDEGEIPAYEAQRTHRRIHESTSVAERLEYIIHPFTSFLIIPIFAVANAGVVLSADSLESASTSPVTLGIVAGLVIGKIVGIAGASFLSVRLGIATPPEGTSVRDLVGVASVAGIGFTVSLFITELAFRQTEFADEAKVGVLVASVTATLIGALLLKRKRLSHEMQPEEA